MSISSELLTLNNTKTAIRTAINNKGGSVGANDTFASYATAIDNLPSGGDNSTLIDLIERDTTSIAIPSGTTKIGEAAFSNITSLTTVNIPSSVTLIKLNAFYGCTGLTSITIPDTVTRIETSAFNSCRNLTSCVLPNSITRITSSCFQNCGLTNISFPSSVTVIESSSFQNCKFVNLTIPDTVTTLGNTAFQGCNQLKSVVIGTGVTNMANAVFYNCTALESVVIKATNPPTQTNAFNNTNDCPIYVPAASVDTYKAASGWSTYASRIFAIEQIATVDGNPVYNYEIGETDSVIGNTEMGNMPTGTSIEFAEGVTRIQGIINGYTTVTLPSTLLGLDNLQNIIGSSVTTLTMKSTTPPTAQANNPGGAGLTAIYVPASAVSTYQSDTAWSSFSSIIQAIPE